MPVNSMDMAPEPVAKTVLAQFEQAILGMRMRIRYGGPVRGIGDSRDEPDPRTSCEA